METNCSETTHVKKGVILAQVKINIQPLNDLIFICTVLKTTYMILTIKTCGFFFAAGDKKWTKEAAEGNF